MEPKISIVIPVYNSEKYLRDCLDSIKNQTFYEFEVICVDDGSSDNSIDIIKEYMKTDNRFNLICKEHVDGVGAGPARNLGISKAFGKYVLVLDSDDFFDNDMLKKCFSKAEELQTDVLIFDAWLHDNDTKVNSNHPLRGPLYQKCIPQIEVFSAKDIEGGMFQLIWGSAWNLFINRSFIVNNKLEFQSTRYEDDVYFSYTSLLNAKRISILNEKLIYYRQNISTSQTSTKFDNPIIMYNAALKIKEYLDSKNLFEEYKLSYWNRFFNPMIYFLKQQREYSKFMECYELLRGRLKVALRFDEFLEVDSSLVLNMYFRNEYKKILEMPLEEYLFENSHFKNILSIDGYWFPEGIKGRKVILYGAGKTGKKFYGSAWNGNFCNIVGWIDKNYSQIGYPVESIDVLNEKVYDYILIAVTDENVRNEIRQTLIDNNVDKKSIIDIKRVN